MAFIIKVLRKLNKTICNKHKQNNYKYPAQLHTHCTQPCENVLNFFYINKWFPIVTKA